MKTEKKNTKKLGRPKVTFKHKAISISLPHSQIYFLQKNKDFNLSKFVQLELGWFMDGLQGGDGDGEKAAN